MPQVMERSLLFWFQVHSLTSGVLETPGLYGKIWSGSIVSALRQREPEPQENLFMKFLGLARALNSGIALEAYGGSYDSLRDCPYLRALGISGVGGSH